MLNTTPEIWKSATTQQFVDVLTRTGDAGAMQNFLRDVLTEKEIIEISGRLEAARLLSSGSNYSQVITATKLSSRTVARISNWMKNGTSGYAAALKIINHNGSTTDPGEA